MTNKFNGKARAAIVAGCMALALNPMMALAADTQGPQTMQGQQPPTMARGMQQYPGMMGGDMMPADMKIGNQPQGMPQGQPGEMPELPNGTDCTQPPMKPDAAPELPEGELPQLTGELPELPADMPVNQGELPALPDGAQPDMGTQPPAMSDGQMPDRGTQPPATPDGQAPQGQGPNGQAPDDSQPPALQDGQTPDGSQPPALPEGQAPQQSNADHMLQSVSNAMNQINGRFNMALGWMHGQGQPNTAPVTA